MRRFIAIWLLVLVPTQYMWSMAQSLHGHRDGDVSMTVLHTHADGHEAVDGHDDDQFADQQSGVGSNGGDDSIAQGDHASHYHPIFSTLVFEPALELAQAAPSGPPARWSAAFTSHIPSQFDRPPSALL